jgi:type II secretory pathway component GspD/PulD (secretin)
MLVAALAGCAGTEAVDRGIIHKSIALKHAAADQVARRLTLEEAATRDHRVVIVADARANAVVVRGTADDLVRLEKRIRELDVR